MVPTFVSSAATDIGPVRRSNQDAFLDWAARGLWAVADGMGGHEAGDEAAKIVCHSLADIPPPPPGEGWPLPALLAAVDSANREMIAFARDNGHSVVGTTLCAVAWLIGDEMAVIWCGDSRVYHETSGSLQQITRDHTVAQRIAETDPALADIVANSKAANTLTHALGVEDSPKVEVTTLKAAVGDRILICSDGLYGVLSREELTRDLCTEPFNLTGRTLIDTALKNATRDNATAIVVQRTG